MSRGGACTAKAGAVDWDLVQAHIPMAEYWARYFARRYPQRDYDDYRSVGIGALAMANLRYQYLIGTGVVVFAAFAYRAVKGSMWDFLRKERVIRRDTYKIIETEEPEEGLEGAVSPAPSQHELLVTSMQRQRLLLAIARLPLPERELLQWHYIEGKTFAEIRILRNYGTVAAVNEKMRRIRTKLHNMLM